MRAPAACILLFSTVVVDGFQALPQLSGRLRPLRDARGVLLAKGVIDASSENTTGAGREAFQRALLEAHLKIDQKEKANAFEVSPVNEVKSNFESNREGVLGSPPVASSEGVVETIHSSPLEAARDTGDGHDATIISSDVHSVSGGKASEDKSDKKAARNKQIRADGGIFAFDTKFGALNPFAIYYGLVSIFLGICWFAVLNLCDLLYIVTGKRFDRLRRLPVFCNHVWGTLLMRFSRSYPKIENRDVLMDFYKQNRAAMFVANHNSWMDIPFMGATIGWRNYKMVAKKELEKVPILGRAITCAKNVCVDRSDRRSQFFTLKAGMQWLKDGVHLCTFPEGTRSRSGRVMNFKNGAFKMAHKVGAPVIPLSIVATGKVMPAYWMFPCRPARGVAKVVVHEPIESEGKTEDELAHAAREAIISGLPDDQRPEK